MEKKKILVALSGGVDSSVAAGLLVKEGHDVMAVTLKTFCYSNIEMGPKACCGLEGVSAAKAVAADLGIPHVVLDVSESFHKEVIEDFVSEYAAGRTPNPCVRCNATVKIPYLLEKARGYGCSHLATGHYAMISQLENGKTTLKRGKDQKKDQSYFLWEVPGNVLENLLLPVGGYEKSEIRKIASEMGFANAQKAESQEICFVPDGNYISFLKTQLPSDHPGLATGSIKDNEGKVVAKHDGYVSYTVGQRKGLGGGHGKRLYVSKIDPETKTVFLGDRDSLMGKRVRIERLNSYIGSPEPGTEFMVQLRYKSSAVACRILNADKDSWHIELKEPVYAISPGQSAVFYLGDLLVAGGRIVSSSI